MIQFVIAVCLEDMKKTEAVLNLAPCTWLRVKRPRELSDYDYYVGCEEETKEKIFAVLDLFKPYYCYYKIKD